MMQIVEVKYLTESLGPFVRRGDSLLDMFQGTTALHKVLVLWPVIPAPGPAPIRMVAYQIGQQGLCLLHPFQEPCSWREWHNLQGFQRPVTRCHWRAGHVSVLCKRSKFRQDRDSQLHPNDH